MEKLEPKEAETIHALDETLPKISETTFAGSSRAIRSVRAKSHGANGELTTFLATFSTTTCRQDPHPQLSARRVVFIAKPDEFLFPAIQRGTK
jgi:hypothetical protein